MLTSMIRSLENVGLFVSVTVGAKEGRKEGAFVVKYDGFLEGVRVGFLEGAFELVEL